MERSGLRYKKKITQKECKIAAQKQLVHPYVCLSVCLCFCVFTCEVLFKRLFAPTSQSWCPRILEIENSWGKVMEGSGLRYENFYS